MSKSSCSTTSVYGIDSLLCTPGLVWMSVSFALAKRGHAVFVFYFSFWFVGGGFFLLLLVWGLFLGGGGGGGGSDRVRV